VTPDTTASLEREFYPAKDDHGTAIVHGVMISSEGSLPPALHVGHRGAARARGGRKAHSRRAESGQSCELSA